jgi:hypothetical protein
MTSAFSLRSPSLLARSALLAGVLAGCAGTAASQDRAGAPVAPRVAILAGPDAPDAAMVRTTRTASGALPDVRRVDSTLEAQAAAAALAGEGYDTVVAVGAQARAAVAQAAAGEVGDGTSWVAAAR